MGAISLKYKSKSGNLTAPGDVDPGAMIPIASTTLTTSAASISITGIPTNYEHLQIRMSLLTQRATYGTDGYYLGINGTYGTNVYSWHELRGDGGVMSSGASGSSLVNSIPAPFQCGTTATNYPATIVMDILDYANTSKYKTLRILGGVDLNGTVAGYGGALNLISGAYHSTTAVTSFELYPQLASFAAGCKVSVYGIKRAGA